jgi:chromosome segregation ATPase
VRLETRSALGRSVFHDVPETGFLIGSVPGCDLRLPGIDLSAALCLVAPSQDGATLRKLLPTQTVLVNGRSVTISALANGDRVGVGPAELVVHITSGTGTKKSGGIGTEPPAASTIPSEPDERSADQDRHEQELQARQEQLNRQQQELAAMRQQLAEIRQQLYDRYRERRDRLAGLQEAIGVAARKVQERKQQLDLESKQAAEQRREDLACKARLEQERSELDQERQRLAEREQGLDERIADLADREQNYLRVRESLEKDQGQYQSDLVRLNRLQAALDDRQEQLQNRAREVDQRFEQLQRTSRELEEQATELDRCRHQLIDEGEKLARRQEEQDAAAAQVAERAAALESQQAMLAAFRTRLERMREELQREQQQLTEQRNHLMQQEQTRGALQEQLRRRSEELAGRQRLLAEQARQREEELAALAAQRQKLEQDYLQRGEQIEADRRQLDARAEAIEERKQALVQREEKLQQSLERLKQAGRRFGVARKALAAECSELERAQDKLRNELEKERAELEAARGRFRSLEQQLPELELRARGAAERLILAREQLREHLAELHNYARQSQADQEFLRAQIQVEAEQVRQNQQALHRAREEHRLAVAAFRQQLIAWQGQLAEMRRTLAQGETRLERRQAQVDEQARRLDASSARLAQQAEQLQEQERVVVERREEIGRHLDDMRDWYRRKLRELSERRRLEEESGRGQNREANAPGGSPGPAPQAPSTEERPTILTMTEPVDPSDRKLGELLRSLDLVDAETLTRLLTEARRQRRSLRQALLGGGYLTLYQMALIETGQLDGLVLGPLRVVDRLRITAHEAVFRVFDPRRSQEAILRHLGEADAVQPERVAEFRNSFNRALAVQHAHIAATLEILDIAGRPAVLQECLIGLANTDWPALVAVPGVWYRLVCQATLGLHTVHEAGLVHGHLGPDQFLLTGQGVLKLCGLCEPSWLVAAPAVRERAASVADDLADLGKLATSWSLLAARRRGAKMKPLPQSLQGILARLTGNEPSIGYTTATALLEDLERAGTDLPPNAEAWERLLRHVREQAAEESRVRQSA